MLTLEGLQKALLEMEKHEMKKSIGTILLSITRNYPIQTKT